MPVTNFLIGPDLFFALHHAVASCLVCYKLHLSPQRNNYEVRAADAEKERDEEEEKKKKEQIDACGRFGSVARRTLTSCRQIDGKSLSLSLSLSSLARAKTAGL